MLNFESYITSLGITDPRERATSVAELQGLAANYQEYLRWVGHDGKTLTRGLSDSIKQNLKRLETAKGHIEPILAAPELDESIHPIPFIHAIDSIAAANQALDKAIQLYTETFEGIGNGQIPTLTPTQYLTMGLLAFIHKSTGALPSSKMHTGDIVGVVNEITGEEITPSWVLRRITDFRGQAATIR
jgi:hypothetical protein